MNRVLFWNVLCLGKGDCSFEIQKASPNERQIIVHLKKTPPPKINSKLKT